MPDNSRTVHAVLSNNSSTLHWVRQNLHSSHCVDQNNPLVDLAGKESDVTQQSLKHHESSPNNFSRQVRESPQFLFILSCFFLVFSCPPLPSLFSRFSIFVFSLFFFLFSCLFSCFLLFQNFMLRLFFLDCFFLLWGSSPLWGFLFFSVLSFRYLFHHLGFLVAIWLCLVGSCQSVLSFESSYSLSCIRTHAHSHVLPLKPAESV